ncbi:hypothetical protein HZB94_01775 [Candidatus Falkowbacteria bacterium]|nr:hypothetical protein [Candidatus Falkowbacteria bacterium]
MTLIKTFREISKSDTAIAGGKGASLGEMTQAGIPVPPGFVILANAFEKFLEETDLNVEIDSFLHSVDHREMHTIENASEKIKALILSAEMPKDVADEIQKFFNKLNSEFVAVRSSATAEDSSTAAWAGQLESYLNTTESTLLENVKKCWASLFTPRAIFYRFEKELHKQKISVAVVIQKMIASESSGVAFSVHPVTQDRNQLIIEAGFGLGEAIVSGQITPDSYVVEKQPRHIIDKNIQTQTKGLYRSVNGGNKWINISKKQGEKQVLSNNEILELSKIILTIENHYDFPCDIEWAKEDNKFYIVQSRPITTLGAKVESKTGVSVAGIEWSLFVTRNMSFWHQVISNYGHYHYAKDWGMNVPLQLLHITVHGTETHVFKNKENAQAFDADVLETFSTKQKITKIKNFYQTFAEQLLERLTRCLHKLSLKNWTDFSESYARFTHGLAVTATMGRIGMDKLIKKLEELGYKGNEIPLIVSVITYPPHHTPLFNSSLDLLEIGSRIQSGALKPEEMDKELTTWLDSHGYIPVNFVDEPWTLKDAKEQLKNFLQKDCEKEIASLNKSHEERSLALRKLLKKIDDEEVSLLAYALQEATFLNEFRKNVFSKVSLKMRPLFGEIARRTKLKSWKECYYLTPNEILDILKSVATSMSGIVKKRGVVGMYTTVSGELVFLNARDTKDVHDFIKSLHTKSQATKNKKTINGFSASTGVVRGTAKIILTSKDFHKIGASEILVTTMTSVDFVPVMEKAAAFVTNEGGITSHAAIVAREMNKPCIIGTKIATQVLKDGDNIEVDANNGIVRILE